MENKIDSKSLSFYYRGLKEDLLKLREIGDAVLDVHLENLFNKVDTLTIGKQYLEILVAVTPIYRGLSDEFYLKKRNIIEPEIKKLVKEVINKLEIYISMVNSEQRELDRAADNSLIKVKERLDNGIIIVNNGVDDMYNYKNKKERLPNLS